MSTKSLITIARKHLGSGPMDSSARLALADAIALHDAGDLAAAKARALKSLAFSVGVFHPDFKAAL